MKNHSCIWVFGYGSLCWRPEFDFEEMVPGHIKDFSRRFWQGNIVHRGTAENPGRVATLIPDENCDTYGCAFRIKEANAKKTIEYLENREVKLGGYEIRKTKFFPSDKLVEPVNEVLVYVAIQGNKDWIGPSCLEKIVNDIASAKGVCGPNSQYVFQLAEFLRTYNFYDEHLFKLEAMLLKKLRGRG